MSKDPLATPEGEIKRPDDSFWSADSTPSCASGKPPYIDCTTDLSDMSVDYERGKIN